MGEQAPNPQFGNELLAKMGDEAAQRQLDIAKYIAETPNTESEVVPVPTPADMVASAASDAHDEYVSRNLYKPDEDTKKKSLIDELKDAQNPHTEAMKVVDKNGHVVTRNKRVEADPTKADDLLDAIARKLVNTNRRWPFDGSRSNEQAKSPDRS